MSTVDLFARIAIAWLTVAAIVLGAYAVAMARHKGRATRRAEHVNWIAVLPPAPQPRESDADWLTPWPTDAGEFDPFWWLTDDDAVSSVIDEMEGEFS